MSVVTHNGRHKPTFYMDPDSQLDFWWIWGNYLQATETISSTAFLQSPATFFTIEDATLSDDAETIDGVAYTDLRGVLVSVDTGAAGEIGELTCRITTSDAGITRIVDRTIKVKLLER